MIREPATRRTLQVVHLGADRREAWNRLAASEPSFGLLQSWEWGEFKRGSWRPFRIAVQDGDRLVAGAQVLVASIPTGLASIAYVPRGPIGDWLDPDVAHLLLAELRENARRRRAIFLRVEPPLPQGSGSEDVLRRHGFRAAAYTNQPRATTIVDLEPSEDEILAQMHGKTRYNIRYAERQGVSVRVAGAGDLPAYIRLLAATGRRTGLNPRSEDYYRREWEVFGRTGSGRLLVAEHEGEPLAANYSAVFGRHAAYLHGASSDAHRNLQPNALLMWEAMRWAKRRGAGAFDLWGIPDEVGLMASRGEPLPTGVGPTDGLWGVYRFKRGFSGQVRLHAEAHDQVYAPASYAALARLLNGPVLDRLAAWRDRLRRRA